MGASNEPKKTALAQASEDAMVVDTMGGRVPVRWDETAQATPHGQILLLAELLATAGVFDRWVQACPLHTSSPNASRPRDALGTLMLGLLTGSKRYAHIEVQDNAQVWEYTVLAANAQYDIAAIGQLYRDRCHCENGFDELKNQGSWGGFTTQDMRRSQVTARAVALVYKWWSGYVRAANPQARRAAQTSRPLLLAAVGRAASSGNQTTLHLTPMHAEAALIKSMIADVHAAIQHVKAAAEQLPKLDRWRALLDYICPRIVGQVGLPTPPATLAAPGWLLLLGSMTGCPTCTQACLHRVHAGPASAGVVDLRPTGGSRVSHLGPDGLTPGPRTMFHGIET